MTSPSDELFSQRPTRSDGEPAAESGVTPPDGTVVLGGAAAPSNQTPQLRDAPPIPGYEFLKRLGKGGMGVVWLARDERAGRLVALKVTRSDESNESDRTRFRTEAQAMARLRHPNVVQVYDVHEHEGRPYFTMEFCPGGGLDAFLDRKPQPARMCAEIVERLALGIQHAHENGIIHRDLKPANVLICVDLGGRSAEVKPDTADSTNPEVRQRLFHTALRNPNSALLKVTDFGLAKNTDSTQRLTQSEAVMGTPSYMAPEQGQSAKAAGAAADIWSLGVILYECVTGSLPFVGASLMEILDHVRGQEPVRPGEKVNCPRDLETICLKCLQKDPKRRYADAGQLAADLRNWLDGRPISARPVGSFERAFRWVRRHRALAALYAVSAVALLALLGLGFWFSNMLGAEQARRGADQKQAAIERQAARDKVAAAEMLAQTQRYFTLLAEVRAREVRAKPGWTWDNLGDLAAAGKLPVESNPVALRSPAAAALAASDVRLVAVVAQGTSAMSVAWHPDGHRLAIGERVAFLSLIGSVTLVDPDRPEQARKLTFTPRVTWKKGGGLFGSGEAAPDYVSDLAFSPDGRWLVAGTRSGKLLRWDLTVATPVAQEWEAHERVIDTLRFAPDGRSVFTVSTNHLRRWDMLSGESKAERTESNGIRGFDVHPWDGSVCYLSDDHLLHSLSGETLQPIRPASPQERGPIRFTPDGMLAVSFRGNVRVRRVAHGFPDQIFRQPNGTPIPAGDADRIEVSPRGDLILVSLAGPEQVGLWSRVDRRRVASLPITESTRRAAFSPDGKRFAVVADRQTRIYEVGGLEVRTLAAPSLLPPHGFAHVPGRPELLVGDDLLGTTLRVWPLESAAPARFPSRLIADTGDTAFIRFVASLDLDRIGMVLRHGENASLVTLRQLGNPSPRNRLGTVDSLGLALGPDGRYWVIADKTLYIRSPDGLPVASWADFVAVRASGKPGLTVLAVGEKYAVVGGRDGIMRVFAADEKREKCEPLNLATVCDSPLRGAAVLGDRVAFFGTDAGRLVAVKLPSGEVIDEVEASSDRCNGVAVTPSGVIATGGRAGDLRLWYWDGDRIRLLVNLPSGESIQQLAFDASGSHLVVRVADEDGLRVWHLDRLRRAFDRLGAGRGFEAVAPDEPRPGPEGPERLGTPWVIFPPPEGRPRGLLAELFADPDLNRCVKTRYEDGLDFEWGAGSPDPAVPGDFFSVRFTGWLKAPAAGDYRFTALGDDTVRVWIDGRLVIDHGPFDPRPSAPVTVPLTGEPQSIRVEMRELGDAARLRVGWSNGGRDRPLAVPYLFPTRELAEKAKVPPLPRK